jgi:hypothetical protein
MFNALWKSVISEDSRLFQGRDKLMTPVFPEGLDDLLAKEINIRSGALTTNS